MKLKVIFGGIFLLLMPILSLGQECILPHTKHVIKITITQIRSDEGLVVVTLHKDSKKFPSDQDAIVASQKTSAAKGTMTVEFNDVSDGEYAVVLHHDENSDGKMNYNFLGIPKEGFGFSQNKPIYFGAPSFESCKIKIDDDATTTVQMKYF